MDTLGIPERSFYRYLSQVFEHDRQLFIEGRNAKFAYTIEDS
jgi:hypothetical protein